MFLTRISSKILSDYLIFIVKMLCYVILNLINRSGTEFWSLVMFRLYHQLLLVAEIQYFLFFGSRHQSHHGIPASNQVYKRFIQEILLGFPKKSPMLYIQCCNFTSFDPIEASRSGNESLGLCLSILLKNRTLLCKTQKIAWGPNFRC